MSRIHWTLACALALLLAPGALGVSLKAGGLTTPDRRTLGEEAAEATIKAQGGTTFIGGASPTMVSASPPANPAAAMSKAMASFAQQQQWAQQAAGSSQQQQQWAQQAMGGSQQQQQWAQQMMANTPQMQQWQQAQQQRQKAAVAGAAAKPAGQAAPKGSPAPARLP
ncbi:hypothetical protein MNEG_1978 [Monoraphidium neglectum]|uniref:Uncharacterized protein n=1 Tax=Monoraphidium neglectum TaxID=145388 RepID=A0A0D2MTS2_9CHLO|nr:hypothetical protein MNEG_1978 [Monoraphidium neglectum]KIZ05970.1 hypothetical protein MNEG_1978 [Monoraphidium neglectum]|eukprot:XP_013904989.1 hypothetical protein MNEG_1978 [Monoraphidium neglectum]